MPSYVIIIAIVAIVGLYLIIRFRKSTGLSYKEHLYIVAERMNENSKCKFRYEIISNPFPGMWGMKSWVKLPKGKMVLADEMSECRIDELLTLLLANERLLYNLKRMEPSEISYNIDEVYSENTKAYNSMISEK